jgi:short-subunit dehydrogenase
VENQIIIITGAASGIGLATTRVFLESGNHVVMADINEDGLLKATEELKHFRDRIYTRVVDITSEKECKKLVEKVIQKYSRIDVLINNAGISMHALFRDSDISVIKRVMDVNFYGTVNCTYYALPYLIASSGSLIGITSVAAKHGLPGRAGYSASKFAIQGFLESVRLEHFKTGLHVLTFAPDFVKTNIRASALRANGTKYEESYLNEKAFISPEKVAKSLFKAIKKRKREVVLTFYGKGTMFTNLFMPKIADRIYYRFFYNEPDSLLK